MNELLDLVQNKYLYIPALLHISVQAFKVLWELVVHKKFDFKRILGAGGMPSSHSTLVTVLTAMIGKNEGFGTPIFAVSFVFALIVMYDACGVRRAAGKQAALLNKIVQTPGLSGLQVQEKLVEVLGHTPIQVIVGAIIGTTVGLIFG